MRREPVIGSTGGDRQGRPLCTACWPGTDPQDFGGSLNAYILAITRLRASRTLLATPSSQALPTLRIVTTGSIDDTSISPFSKRCTMTLPGSVTPICGSSLSASKAQCGLHAPRMR